MGLVGTFDAADGIPWSFAVDEARGRLYGAYQSAGLRRFTYPGLVNLDGPGGSWFDNPGTEVSGVAVRPSDGDIIFDERGTSAGDGRTYYRVDFDTETQFTVASEAGSPGVFPPATFLTWHPGDSTVYGLTDTVPVRLIEVDLGGSSVVDPVATFAGVEFAGVPHVTRDGAIWFVANQGSAPTDVVARYDGTLSVAAFQWGNYGFGRCNRGFVVADVSGDWAEWDAALGSSGSSVSLDPVSAASFTGPSGVAWSVDAADRDLWKVPCGRWALGSTI